MVQVFAVQRVQGGEFTGSGADGLHRRLIERAPVVRESLGVELLPVCRGEGRRLPGNAGAPVHHSPEGVEEDRAHLPPG
jgi:hypothetical protein